MPEQTFACPEWFGIPHNRREGNSACRPFSLFDQSDHYKSLLSSIFYNN